MGENTVEVNGVAFDAENLLEAAQDVSERPDGRGMSLVGDICVADDGYDDRGVQIHKDGTKDEVCIYVDRAVDMAETALEDSFESYVTDAVSDFRGNYKVGVEVKNRIADMFGHGYDILLWKNFSLTADLMEELINDGGIELGYVKPVDNGVLVGLNDSRE